ncbi:hypothetical protein BJ742DRAFT_734140 [Cladochytrium replicatum]|nr:hypothetical protein BJ742DRAFT_734140 [Cladochytrium replicatum]
MDRQRDWNPPQRPAAPPSYTTHPYSPPPTRSHLHHRPYHPYSRPPLSPPLPHHRHYDPLDPTNPLSPLVSELRETISLVLSELRDLRGLCDHNERVLADLVAYRTACHQQQQQGRNGTYVEERRSSVTQEREDDRFVERREQRRGEAGTREREENGYRATTGERSSGVRPVTTVGIMIVDQKICSRVRGIACARFAEALLDENREELLEFGYFGDYLSENERYTIKSLIEKGYYRQSFEKHVYQRGPSFETAKAKFKEAISAKFLPAGLSADPRGENLTKSGLLKLPTEIVQAVWGFLKFRDSLRTRPIAGERSDLVTKLLKEADPYHRYLMIRWSLEHDVPSIVENSVGLKMTNLNQIYLSNLLVEKRSLPLLKLLIDMNHPLTSVKSLRSILSKVIIEDVTDDYVNYLLLHMHALLNPKAN